MKKLYLFTFLLLALTSCTHLFYYPKKESSRLNQKLKLHIEEGFLPSADGTQLNYWYISFEKNKHILKNPIGLKTAKAKGLFLQFHGNAQNMTFHFINALWVLEYGYDLLVFDYRGYGLSEGSPSPSGLHQDAMAILKYAESRAPQENLITYGQSLGGTVLLYALSEGYKPKNLKNIVIESSFYSYNDTAREKLSQFWLTWPLQWMAYLLINNSYSPEKAHLENLTPTPTYLLYSKKDPVVSYDNASLIYDHLEQPKELWSFDVYGHIIGMWVQDCQYQMELIKKIEGLNQLPHYCRSE